jgi:class 3 adenylate cyclase
VASAVQQLLRRSSPVLRRSLPPCPSLIRALPLRPASHSLLERYFELVDQTVTRFGGTIDKHIGDGAMALFGAPVAHGNDAERAVRASLAIHAGLETLSRELGTRLTCHIGRSATTPCSATR